MRHTRQSRLADVGGAGQERIARARVALAHDGLAGVVEARYLAGAGVLALSGSEEAIAEARRVDAGVREAGVGEGAGARETGAGKGSGAASELDALDPAAREVARGALAALAALKRALAGET